jgi:hypothetical protein
MSERPEDIIRASLERLTFLERHRGGSTENADKALAALVAVRAERDRLILAIRSHAPKQADAIIDVAAVSSPGEDGLVLRCSLAAIHSPHCWAMYGDDDSPWYRCPGEETP